MSLVVSILMVFLLNVGAVQPAQAWSPFDDPSLDSPDAIQLDLLDPDDEVPKDLLARAVAYLNANMSMFPNRDYISIVDFRPRSDHFRLFVVNLSAGSVARYHTAHGSGSVRTDPGYATLFGNEVGSNKSSLGFVRTGDVYFGSQKRSLRLEGLSSGNSHLMDRGIIVHGADQVHESASIQGLGAGCIMLDWRVRDEVINKIRDGSLMYFGYSKKADQP